MSFLSILMYNARFSSDKEHSRGKIAPMEGELSAGRLTENSQNLRKNVFLGSPVVASFIDIQKRVRWPLFASFVFYYLTDNLLFVIC